MKKYIFFIMITCSFFHYNYGEEFIYPVADFDNGNQLLVIYQKSLQDVELWIWDNAKHYAIQGLLSFITPANLRMLPSGNGFSFIDSGYIKIKEFTKRSPRTIPIYEPIGLFSSMNWIDQENFYFVAREGDFFQIFQSDIEANIKRLTYDAADALYPQKIGSYLFYIKRNQENNQFFIIRKKWDPISIDDNITTEYFDEEIISKHNDQQICYLKMVSNQEGFFLQAPTVKVANDDAYQFICFHFFLQDCEKWVYEELFKFKVPAKYITGKNRLYESIEPFLPNYAKNNQVYFVTWQNEEDQCNLVKFDMIKKNLEYIIPESLDKDQRIFAPYIQGNKIYYGLILENKNLENRFLKKENPYFQLPFFYKNQNNFRAR